MRPSRPILAILAAAMLTVLAVAPAAATRPTRPAPPAPPSGERPLTPEEAAAAERRVLEAEAFLAQREAAGADLATLSCVTPQSSSAGTLSTCTVPKDSLAVEARDQIAGHYCGPAVGQVIANYSWAMRAGVNKYTQTRIAGWMQTDRYGSTDAHRLEDGLELGTRGAPRRPAGWDWVVLDVRDRDADGTTGDELHGYVRSNVTNSNMPLAIPVKPHDPASLYNLSSWPNPVRSMGHWIAAYGWYGLYDGTNFARTYYTDSSRDEGGSTGKFWNPTRTLSALVREHTGRIVW